MGSKVQDALLTEIKKGGKESPCPFCSLPRVKRSSYIRCCACGINWMEDEPLDKDPRGFRQRRLIDNQAATSTRTKREEPTDARR